MNLTVLQQSIPQLQNATAVSKISKGFSYDGKYLVYEGGALPAYVLRTAALDQRERKRLEFEAVSRIHSLGVRTSEPVAFGTVEELDLCCIMLRYVEGEDASEKLPLMTADVQYRIGFEAGRGRGLMHEAEPSGDMEAWAERKLAKYNRQLAEYRRCGVQLPEEDAIAAFIDRHLPLMEGRPNRFQHDDFHPANLLVKDGAYAAVIDFNRFDWGDPYHDFLKIAYFSREVSVPFSAGQVNGYFNGSIPGDFWPLYALYTAINLYGTITWTLQVVPDQLDSMMSRIRTVLGDHRNFEKRYPGMVQRIKWVSLEEADRLMPYHPAGVRSLIEREAIPYHNEGRQ